MAKNNLIGKIKRDVSIACGGLTLILNSSCVYLGLSFPISNTNQVYQSGCPTSEPSQSSSEQSQQTEVPEQPLTYPEQLEAYLVHEDGTRFAPDEKLTIPNFRIRIAVPEEVQKRYGGPVTFQMCSSRSTNDGGWCSWADDCFESYNFSQLSLVPNILGIYESRGSFLKFSFPSCNSSPVEGFFEATITFNGMPENVITPINLEF